MSDDRIGQVRAELDAAYAIRERRKDNVARDRQEFFTLRGGYDKSPQALERVAFLETSVKEQEQDIRGLDRKIDDLEIRLEGLTRGKSDTLERDQLLQQMRESPDRSDDFER